MIQIAYDPELGKMISATPKILPAVYEDALTYIEQLKVLNNKLNECIKTFNDYGNVLLVESKEYTDQRINELNIDINNQLDSFQMELDNALKDLDEQLKAELEKFREDAQNEFEWFKQRADELFELFVDETIKLNSRINELQISINVLFEMMSRTKLEIRRDVEGSLTELKAWVEQQIAYKHGSEIIVKNPITLRLTSLNKALQDILDVMGMIGSLTVDEYNSLHLTAYQYNEYKITAYVYLYRVRWMFLYQLYFPDLDERFNNVYDYIYKEVDRLDKNHYMISPFDGKLTPIHIVIDRLAELHMDGITADQYNILAITVDEYAGKMITAYNYAWNGYYILNTGATPKPVLEEQIRELQVQLADAIQRIQDLENETGGESATIVNIKNDIAQNTKDININTGEIAAVKENLNNLESVTIPEEIQGLQDTFNTTTSGLQTQITEISSGLQSIHINWKTTSTYNNIRRKKK